MIHPMNTTQACGRPRCLDSINPSRIMHHLNISFHGQSVVCSLFLLWIDTLRIDSALATEVLPYSANPYWRYQRRACKNEHIVETCKGTTKQICLHERVQLFSMCAMSSKVLGGFLDLWIPVSSMSMAMASTRQPGNSLRCVVLMLSPSGCRDQIGALQRPPLPHGIRAPWLTVARFQIFRMIPVQSDC